MENIKIISNSKPTTVKKPRAAITNYSDRTPSIHLATPNEITLLEMRANKKEAEFGFATKYLQLKEEKEKESKRKYPSKEHIADIDKCMERLREYYDKFYDENGNLRSR